MTQVFSSPGVYTQEIDQSYRAPLAGVTPGPAVIGYSDKGMAFRPVTLRSGSDFTEIFGEYRTEYYGSLAIQRYFNGNGNRPLSFTRVLGTGTSSIGKPIFLAFPSGSTDVDNVFRNGNIVGAILRLVTDDTQDYKISGSYDDFSLQSTDQSVNLTNLSLNPAAVGYIGNKIAKNPLESSSYVDAPNIYIDAIFDYQLDDYGTGSINNTLDSGFASATGNGSFVNIAGGFSHASTPWVVSQDYSGTIHNLFRFHTISHGEYENSNFKVNITNVDTDSSEYPKFTVVLTTAWDSSNRSKGNKLGDSYGQWTVSLDPNADDYLPKIIGDQYIEYDMSQTPPTQIIQGENRGIESKPYIRVELANVAPASARPSGFRGVGRISPQGDLTTSVAANDISFSNVGSPTITSPTNSLVFINAGKEFTVDGTSKSGFTAAEGANGTPGTTLVVNSTAGVFAGSPIADDQGKIPAGTVVDTVTDGTTLELSQSFLAFTGTLSLTATNNDGTFVAASDGTASTVVSTTNFPVSPLAANETDTDGGGTYTISEVDQEYAQIPSIPYKTDHVGNTAGTADSNVYMGPNFAEVGLISRLKCSVTNSNGSLSADKGLLLYSKTSELYSTSANIANSWTQVNLKSDSVVASEDAYGNGAIRFSLPFFGGNDAIDPRVDRVYAANASDSSSLTGSFERAISVLSNPDLFTFDLLAIPGIHSSAGGNIAQKAINMVTARGDAFYILDIASGNSSKDAGVNTTLSLALTEAAKFDTSFAATYFPWPRIIRGTKDVAVPPSVVMLGVFGLSDRIAQPWYAPAGFTRGGLGSDVRLIQSLNQSQRDSLYENGINPLARFVGQGGAAVFGQKTLQKQQSVLDRINVRRMLLEVKKNISGLARQFLFEPNDASSRNNLLIRINEYLNGVQTAQGLTEFRAILDETTTTPDLVDRNIMKGKIFLKPTSAAEVILFDLTVSPQGATLEG